MRTVKLLKPYLSHSEGTVINVDNNVAFGLVDSGVGTYDLGLEAVEKRETKVVLPTKRGRKLGYRIK